VTTATDERMAVAADIAQALAHPARLRILDLLRSEGAYVMHLTALLGRPQANVSQHLAVLREAELVVDERDGMTVVYRIRDPQVYEVVDRLLALAGRRTARDGQQPLQPPPQTARGCRCPRCGGR